MSQGTAGVPGALALQAMEQTTMRKILALLDEEQREALLELTDFGIAAFSAGLAVAMLKGMVDFVTLLI